jgi:hypothetical protein
MTTATRERENQPGPNALVSRTASWESLLDNIDFRVSAKEIPDSGVFNCQVVRWLHRGPRGNRVYSTSPLQTPLCSATLAST